LIGAGVDQGNPQRSGNLGQVLGTERRPVVHVMLRSGLCEDDQDPLPPVDT
jgi:hypothetical protein